MNHTLGVKSSHKPSTLGVKFSNNPYTLGIKSHSVINHPKTALQSNSNHEITDNNYSKDSFKEPVGLLNKVKTKSKNSFEK